MPIDSRAHVRALALAATLAAAAVPALAEVGPDEEPAIELDKVITVEGTAPQENTGSVATRINVPLDEQPLSLTVVSAATFEEQTARVLGDALINAPGVVVHTNSGVNDFFSIRGFDSLTGSSVMTDGAIEPEATFYHLYNLSRIEVLRGPAGFLYGGGSLAGAAQLVRKQPLPATFGDARFELGSFGTVRGLADVNVGSADGGLAFRFNALVQSSDGWRDGRESDAVGLNPSASFSIGDDASIVVNGEWVRNEYMPDTGLPIVGDEVADVPRERSYQSPLDFSEQNLGRLRVDYVHRLNDRFTLSNKTYWTRLDWDTLGTLVGPVFPGPGGLLVSRSLLDLEDEQNFFGNRFETLFQLGDGIRHELVAGFEVARYADEFTLTAALLDPVALDDPVESGRPPFPIPGQSQVGDARSLVFAPYILDRIHVSDRFQLWLGGRLDHIDYEDEASATERTATEFSPMLGARVQATDDLSLYVNAGRGFAPPSTRVVGERDPEESRQVELGARVRLFEGRLRLGVAGYHVERRDIAIPNDDGFTAQTGSQRARGLEIDVEAETEGGLRTQLVYAYNDAELTEFRESLLVALNPPTFAVVDHSGNTPAFAPDHLLRLWVAKEIAGGFGAGGGLRWVGEQFIAEDNAFAIDSYVTFDLSVWYGLSGFRFDLNFSNLFDEEYLTRGFGSSSVLPGQPFAVSGGATYRF